MNVRTRSRTLALRNMRSLSPLGVILFAFGCTQCSTATTGSRTDGSRQVTQPTIPLACSPQPGSEQLTERASAYDSTRVTIANQTAQICYSRPSAKGRTIFGGLIPYGRLWRTGANEPTILHLPFAADIAGMRVEPGSYSLYTVPTAGDWTLIVNRSTSQWGHESLYKPEIEAQEVGRATLSTEHLDDFVETLTIATRPAGPTGADLLLSWERTQVRIPIRLAAR